MQIDVTPTALRARAARYDDAVAVAKRYNAFTVAWELMDAARVLRTLAEEKERADGTKVSRGAA